MCVRMRSTPEFKCKCHQDFLVCVGILQVVTEHCYLFLCDLFNGFFLPIMFLCLRGRARPGFRAKCHVVFLVNRVRIIVFTGMDLWALTD